MTEQAPPSESALVPDAAASPPSPTSPEPAEPAPSGDGDDAVGSANASLLRLVDRLSALLDRTELTELEVQVGATGLVLRKPSAIAPAMPVPVTAAAGSGAGSDGSAVAAASAGTAAPAGPPARPAVMAPLSGIWYGAPAPGSAPYVSLGGEVAVGQVIGLIEAMKLFNEIKSDKAGRVVKINAEDGKLVRAKQPLIEVDPL
jgi:acetyl-CoA carboxylase biotin carboxyl carrier protein